MRSEITATADLTAATERFHEFVARSRALLHTTASNDPSDAFRSFVEQASPLIVAPIRQALVELRERVRLLRPWIMPHDLLAVAGLEYNEDAYTELIAWALHPRTHPPSAKPRQRAWLESLRLPVGNELWSPADPITQVSTADGIPDLVLRYDDIVVVVEAKTGSAEHDTPSGTPQTRAYPRAVANALRLAPYIPVHIVFLTPDRRAADNPDAVCTSYLDFVVALARALDPAELPDDLRTAFKMLFTHLTLHAVPLGYDSRPVLLEEPPWLAPNVGTGVIVNHLLAIHDAIGTFLSLEPS